jgi:hypothetical protein
VNLVNPLNFIRKENVGIVCVIKLYIDVQNPNVKILGWSWV